MRSAYPASMEGALSCRLAKSADGLINTFLLIQIDRVPPDR